MNQTIELSIIMPCLNEAETLAVCIGKALGFLERTGIDGEVLIADNGSTDGSPQIAREAGARVVAVAEKGYGRAFRGGIESAMGRYVIMGDADDSYDFVHLLPFVERLRAGDDLVMGNRFRGGIEPGAMPPLHRYLGNPVLTQIGRLFFGSPSGDFHCGLRGFNRESILKLNLRTTGMEFASEMIVRASLEQLRISEVPTTLSKDGRSRPPHLRSWRDGWRHLRFLLMYCPRWLFLYPVLALMAVGLLLGCWLWPGPRMVAGVVFDFHTLFYAGLAVVIGYQSVIFAISTLLFVVSAGMMPANRSINRILGASSLEKGLIAGLALLLLGLAGTVWAVADWGLRSFGPVDPGQMMRLLIPSGTALVIGCQTIFASFFLSILGLRRR